MKAKISELMDGELDEHAATQAIGALSREGEAGEAWRIYHLIGDAMRDSRVLSEGFSERLRARLAQEPTVLAPARIEREPRRWVLPAAASLAAVALVGWLGLAPQPERGEARLPLAQAPAAPAPAMPEAMIPFSSETNDYLLAHQAFSPRNSLQGMAAYVRTVSGGQREARK